VSELGEEQAGAIVCSNVDATTPESVKAVEELEFGNHGLVIRSGSGDVLWKQADHSVDMTEVRSAVSELLAKQ
jgi:hypothetical protein